AGLYVVAGAEPPAVTAWVVRPAAWPAKDKAGPATGMKDPAMATPWARLRRAPAVVCWLETPLSLRSPSESRKA
ncbi:MAG: hypothetical protein ACK56I_22490, partial [bacterium]